MKRIAAHQKEQGVLFSTNYINDRLPEFHPIYAFNALLDKLNISKIMQVYSERGGKMHDPKNLLAVVLNAYLKGITSSRKIAELTRTDIPTIYLAGGSIYAYRTICDFRVKNMDYFKELFGETIRMALEIELIKPSDIYGIDGSKFEANASRSQTKTKAAWVEKKTEILAAIDKYLAQWSKEDDAGDERPLQEEQDAKNQLSEMLRKLEIIAASGIEKSDSKALAEDEDAKNPHEIHSAEAAIKQIKKVKKIEIALAANADAADDRLVNLTDPVSSMMLNDHRIVPSYNLQIATANQFVAALAVTNEENDQKQAVPMVEQLIENIQPADSENKIKALFDAGYNAGANLAQLDANKNVDAYVSMNDRSYDELTEDQKKFHKNKFTYNEDEDQYACPAGQILEFSNESIDQDGKKHTTYAATPNQCQRCPFKEQCLQTKGDQKLGYRKIVDDGYNVYRNEMRTKMETKEAKQLYKKRGIEPEPVFGNIKNNRGIWRLLHRGTERVTMEFHLIFIGQNLGKLMMAA